MQLAVAIDQDVAPATHTMLALGRGAVVALLLAVSPLALVLFGWQYFDTGGSPLEKFHPATLLAAGLVGLIAAAHDNPLTGLIEMAKRHEALIPYVAANGFMMAYTAVMLHQPVTIFIETYLGAALVLVAFQNLDEREARRLALLIHALMLANGLLAFYEVAAGFHLTPLVVNGEELTDEPRATALLGHPLANAILVGGYSVMLALGGARDLPLALRPVCCLVALASLIAFGGRAATAATLLALTWLGLRRLMAIVRGAPFDPRLLLAGVILVPLAGLAVTAAADLGAFDTFASRLFDDEGSASTRVEMFTLFRYLSPYDLAFGPDPDVLMTWVRLHGLDYGIESFVVAFVLTYGLLAATLFFPPLAVFFWHLARSSRPGSWLVIVHFLAVSLTSISLSSKSPTLSVFVLLTTVLLRPAPSHQNERRDIP